MKTKYFLFAILFTPFLALAGLKKSARAPKSLVQLAKCTSLDLDRCEYMPTYREVPLPETALFKQSWGTVFVSSTPVEESEVFKGNDLKISLQCEASDKKVILSERVCGYQKYSAYPDLNIKAFFVDYNPMLNISEDGEKVTVLIRTADAQGECKVEKTISVPITCPKAARR